MTQAEEEALLPDPAYHNKSLRSPQLATRKVRRVGNRIYKTSLVKKMKMTQSLIISIDTNIDFTINDNVDRCKIIVSTAMMFERGIRYPTVCLGYVIVALATLPVGLWSGGWPFFLI